MPVQIRSPFPVQESNRALYLLFLLLISASVVGVWFIGANLRLTHPLYQFETADVFGTSLLRQGINPYSLASHPVYLYSYGIVPTLIAYLPALFLHTSFGIHRAISVLSLFLACAVLFRAIRLSGGRASFAAIGALLLFVQHAFSVSIAAKPGCLGILFLLLGAVIPLAGNFRRLPVFLGLLCALLGFYTKPYFILIAPALTLYLFVFRSKRDGLLAAVFFLFLLLASGFLVDRLLPLYFTDILFVLYNFGVGHASVLHLGNTLWLFFKRDFGLILLIGWGAWRGLLGGASREARWRIDFCDFDQPLLCNLAPSYPLILSIPIGLAYLFVLGLNAGGGTDYIYQLLLPFLIWQCALIASRAAQVEPGLQLPTGLFLLVALTLVSIMIPKRVVPFLRQRGQEAASWRHVDEIIASHQDILNDLYFGIQLRNAGRPIYNGGQATFYPFSFAHNPSSLTLAYREQCRKWREAIDQKIQDRGYDAVLTTSTDPSIVPADLLVRFYRPVETFPLIMTFASANVTLWEPRQTPIETP